MNKVNFMRFPVWLPFLAFIGTAGIVAAGPHTASACDRGCGTHTVPAAAACSAGNAAQGAPQKSSACDNATPNRGVAFRLAAAKKGRQASSATQTAAAASVADSTEAVFVGTGDMSAGSWDRP